MNGSGKIHLIQKNFRKAFYPKNKIYLFITSCLYSLSSTDTDTFHLVLVKYLIMFLCNSILARKQAFRYV